MNAFDSLKTYGKAWLQLMKGHFDLFLLEARLAKLSIFPLISFSLLFVFLLFTAWLIFLGIVFYLVFLLNSNLLLALLVVFVINALFLFIAGLYTKSFYRNLHFEKTREHWKTYQQLQLEFDNDPKNTESTN